MVLCDHLRRGVWPSAIAGRYCSRRPAVVGGGSLGRSSEDEGRVRSMSSLLSRAKRCLMFGLSTALLGVGSGADRAGGVLGPVTSQGRPASGGADGHAKQPGEHGVKLKRRGLGYAQSAAAAVECIRGCDRDEPVTQTTSDLLLRTPNETQPVPDAHVTWLTRLGDIAADSWPSAGLSAGSRQDPNQFGPGPLSTSRHQTGPRRQNSSSSGPEPHSATHARALRERRAAVTSLSVQQHPNLHTVASWMPRAGNLVARVAVESVQSLCRRRPSCSG